MGCQVTPNYHFSGDCEAALRLYEKAFNGKLTGLLRYGEADPEDMSTTGFTEAQKNRIYHAEMMIGDQRFMFSDSLDEIPVGQNVSIVLIFDTSDEVIAAYDALVEGASIIHPMQHTTYSSCFVSLVDKFGMRWELMTETPSGAR